jgi:hypothetical protein
MTNTMLTSGNVSGSDPVSFLDNASASLVLAWLSYSATTTLVTLYNDPLIDSGRIKLSPDPTTQAPTRRAALYRILLNHLAADLHKDGDAVDEDVFWREVRSFLHS